MGLCVTGTIFSLFVGMRALPLIDTFIVLEVLSTLYALFDDRLTLILFNTHVFNCILFYD